MLLPNVQLYKHLIWTNIPECVEAEVFTFNVDCNYNPLIPASAELEVTGEQVHILINGQI